MPGLYDDILTEPAPQKGPGIYDDIINEPAKAGIYDDIVGSGSPDPSKPLQFTKEEDLSKFSPEQLQALDFKRKSEAGLIPYTPYEAKTIFDPVFSLPRYAGRQAQLGGTTPVTESVGGAYNAAAGLAEGLTSPAALGSIAVGGAFPVVGKILSGAWAAKMGSDIPTQIGETYKAYTEPEVPLFEKVEKPLSLLASLFFTGAAAKHAVSGTPIARILPRTIEALKETPGKAKEPTTVKEAEAVNPEKGVADALKNLEAEKLHGDVPEQSGKGQQGLPAQEGAGGVPSGRQAQAEAQIRDVLLKEEAPSPQAMGITPPGAGLLREVVDAFKPKVQERLPEAPSTAGEWLPDLGDRAINKEIAVDPTGIGRVPILNWFLDPRHRVKTEPEKAIMGWTYERAMGDAHVKALGSTFGTKFKEQFPRDPKTGEFATVGRTEPGQSLHPSDVFERLQIDPEAYKLTPEQRGAFNELMTYEKRARELEQKYGIRENQETGEYEPGKSGSEAYYTRGKPIGKPKPKGAGGGSLGGRQFFEKPRAFESEQQGASNGFRYPLNVDDRVLFRLGRLYKAIADRRLAEDESLGGHFGKATYGEQAVFQPAFRRSYVAEGKGVEPIPITEHKIFPADVAEKLNQKFNSQQTGWLKAIGSVNDFVKSLSLGIDMGAGQIQGLVTAFRDPGAWAKAQSTMLKAFASKDGFAAYLRGDKENIQAARELAQYGSSIGSLPEMIAGLEKGSPVSKLFGFPGKVIEAAGQPRLGRAVGHLSEVPTAFGRSFQTFLDVAKIERWKAQREVTPREEWSRSIQTIEHELQSGRMETIGLHPAQALAERLVLLAPSYYRGAISLIGDMTQKGVSGAQARRAMGSYMIGTFATFAAFATALGLSQDEMKRRLNPQHGNFLMVPVKVGGKEMEVGFGGIMRSFMRLGGNLLKTAVDHPENLKSISSEKNPVVKWLRGHSSPAVGAAWNLLSEQDYMGKDADLTTQSRALLPLWVQELWRKEKGEPASFTAANMVASFMGLNAYPQSTRNKMIVERDRLSKEKFGQSYDDLKIRQQMMVSRTLNKNPEFAIKDPATPQQIERAFRNQVERQQRVQDSLAKPIQQVLAEKGLHVTGYEPTLRIGQTKLFLTEDQTKRYEALIVEEYNRSLKNRARILGRMDPIRGQKLLNDWVLDAKERAQTRLRLEFNR